MNQPGNHPEDLMTPAEVAAYFRVNSVSVHRWAKAGRLPVAVITPGGHRRFRRSDVIALSQPGQAPPQPGP